MKANSPIERVSDSRGATAPHADCTAPSAHRRTTHRPHVPHRAGAHPLENLLASVTVVFGLVSIATAGTPQVHLLGAVTGLCGVVIGLFDQYISSTTAERMVIVPAIGASAVGLFIAVANGGFAA